MKTPHRLVLAVFLCLAASSLRAETADQWIAKARVFLGGESALNAVNTVHFTGTLEIETEIKLPTEIVFQKPYRQRITVTGPKVIETTALDGYDAWQKRTNTQNPLQWQVTLLDSNQVKKLRANTMENLNFYSAASMKGCMVEVVGDVTVDGLACVKLSFTHIGNVVFLRFFDKATGRLVKTETENGGEIREEGELFVNGVRFPKRVVNKAPSGKITAITFEKVAINESFAADTFSVPSLQTK